MIGLNNTKITSDVKLIEEIHKFPNKSLKENTLQHANIILIRGLPGSGKTSFADMIDYDYCIATDDFFIKDGIYDFKPELLPVNHNKCIKMVKEKVNRHRTLGCNIVVHNTFSERWEMQPYINIALEYGFNYRVTDIYDGGLNDEELFKRNEHGVPLESICNMRSRWEFNWRVGNPNPPWERNMDENNA